MGRRKDPPHHRADTRGGGWTGLPHVVQDSPAFRGASLWARAALLELMREFNGYNNGTIYLSVAQLCERLGTQNKGKVCRALAELMERGLIDLAADAKWRQRMAREYRLTFIASGTWPAIKPATNEYRLWGPEKSRGEAVSPERGPTGEASSPEPGSAGEAVSPEKFERLLKTAISAEPTPLRSGEAGSLHIVMPSPGLKAEGENTPAETPQITAGRLIAFPVSGCEKCGKPVMGGGRGSPKRFCSERCRKAAENARRHERARNSA